MSRFSTALGLALLYLITFCSSEDIIEITIPEKLHDIHNLLQDSYKAISSCNIDAYSSLRSSNYRFLSRDGKNSSKEENVEDIKKLCSFLPGLQFSVNRTYQVDHRTYFIVVVVSNETLLHKDIYYSATHTVVQEECEESSTCVRFIYEHSSANNNDFMQALIKK